MENVQYLIQKCYDFITIRYKHGVREIIFFLENWPFKLGKNLWRYSLVWHYTYLSDTTVISGVHEISHPNKRNRSIGLSGVTICYYLRYFSK